jgi:hypothetical protein
MANITRILSGLLNSGSGKRAQLLPGLLDGARDRIDHDLAGLSDTDAMWYYERRRWQGRD